MSTPPKSRHDSGRRAVALATSALLAVCLGPYLVRLGSPSLYADDVARVEQLQTIPVGTLLFLPFNEHMAPLFQGVSWLTWQIAGRSLANAPLAFTLASFLPLIPALGLLARLVRRETGSATTAATCVASFSISWLAIETVYWYSASSFLWALVATEVAWLGSAAAVSAERTSGRWKGIGIATLGAALAPAFSAIGLLAGPIAALRVLAEPSGRLGPVSYRARLTALAAPIAGTSLYLAVCAAFRYHAVLASSLERNINIGPGLLATFRAPVEVLLPALIGIEPDPASGAWRILAIALSLTIGATLLWRAWRKPPDRPLVLGGLALVVGGHALVFCARADEPGHSVLQTQRYHLFPMLGLVLLLAPFLKRVLARFDVKPAIGIWVATAVAAVLLVTHFQEMRGRARFLRYPDQVRTLAALDRLGSLCKSLGVTRARAIAALDPIETEWTPPGYSALVMLPACAPFPILPDALVKPVLLAALSASERRSICGGMDATPYLQTTGAADTRQSVATGRPIRLFRVRRAADGRYDAEGWPSFVEFEMTRDGSDPSPARAIELSAEVPAGTTEVWWKAERGRWSETRSVRLKSGPASPHQTWSLPLDRLPHWDPSEASRIRLLFHKPGRVGAAGPRLLR